MSNEKVQRRDEKRRNINFTQKWTTQINLVFVQVLSKMKNVKNRNSQTKQLCFVCVGKNQHHLCILKIEYIIFFWGVKQ